MHRLIACRQTDREWCGLRTWRAWWATSLLRLVRNFHEMYLRTGRSVRAGQLFLDLHSLLVEPAKPGSSVSLGFSRRHILLLSCTCPSGPPMRSMPSLAAPSAKVVVSLAIPMAAVAVSLTRSTAALVASRAVGALKGHAIRRTAMTQAVSSMLRSPNSATIRRLPPSAAT